MREGFFFCSAAIQITAAESLNPAYTGTSSHKQMAGSLTVARRDKITMRGSEIIMIGVRGCGEGSGRGQMLGSGIRSTVRDRTTGGGFFMSVVITFCRFFND